MPTREKSIPDLLSQINKFQGGQASIWSYGISHRILVIKVNPTGDPFFKNVHITCGDCEHISGPFRWFDYHFGLSERVNPDGEKRLILKDASANFALDCGIVWTEENAQPILEPEPEHPAESA